MMAATKPNEMIAMMAVSVAVRSIGRLLSDWRRALLAVTQV
jgi:hypothetical protein